MPDIFDEIEEDFRADRTRRLAKRWGGVALGVALLVLAAFGGWQAWRWNDERQAATAAETYLALHRTAEARGADLPAVAEGFSTLAQSAPDGYRTLARLRAAALKAETGDIQAALALWDAVARDSAAEALYRDLAALLYVGHGLETVDPAQLAARIGPLTQPGNAWQAPAREMAALVAIRRGDMAEARQQLQALAADTAATPGLRERAQRLAAGLGS
ncbi:tetratricopeptide repeat protein [Falsiroseomonas sp.]|uniref:tetratricopeptide repeat protein n=1 Tax=Falsiroseomonas sp. TaxID=2870721 RepID=UPI0027280C42|nr:tetratricopeptide repeat protein [Falsiroseomonas sp.]MDO9501757.1 tetratricopeptide repeat protein [Falsiroseomonas sp.]MDP3415343.1 tetratricopeptide repeat protein [Falsiroseomonas sp.]